MPQSSTEGKSLDTPVSNTAKPAHHEEFASQWKNFEVGVKGLSGFSQYINSLELDLNKIKRLEVEIRTKTTENSALQTGRQQMLEGFAEKYKDWEGKKNNLEGELRVASKEIRSLHNQLADLSGVVEDKTVEVQRRDKSMDALEKKLKKLEVELNNTSTLLRGNEVELRICQTDLKERKDEIGLEELSVDFVPALNNLSAGFHTLAREYFFTTLPKGLNGDDIFVELQRSHFMSVLSRAIPISNSKASRYLRMAAAESIIAKKVTENILQPLYILDPHVQGKLENVLDTLFEDSPRQESILRSVLLAAYASEGTIRETDLLEAVVESARNILNPLLFDEVHRNAFTAGIHKLLVWTLDLWSQAQKSPERVLASVEGKDWEWGSYEEHDNAVPVTAAELALVSSTEPITTLFPRIYSPKKSVPWHSGYSLWSDQGVVVAGNLEAKDQAARVNSRIGRKDSMVGKRRISVSSPATNLSFQQRMKRHSESTSNSNAEEASVTGSVAGRQLEKALPRVSGTV